MAVEAAFQGNAFQQDAFQVFDVADPIFIAAFEDLSPLVMEIEDVDPLEILTMDISPLVMEE